MLGFDGEYTAVQPKSKLWQFSVKNRKKSPVKHSIDKPILLNFFNLSPTLFIYCMLVLITGTSPLLTMLSMKIL